MPPKVDSSKKSWVLVFWPNSEDVSIELEVDIARAIAPNHVCPGWRGILPWKTESGIEDFEAVLLKVSANKSYLSSLKVDKNGKVLPKIMDANVAEEKKKIRATKKQKETLAKKSSKDLDKSVLSTPSIFDSPKSLSIFDRKVLKSKLKQNPQTRVDDSSIPKMVENAELNGNMKSSCEVKSSKTNSTNVSKEKPNDEVLCANCKKCICKNWLSNVTPDLVAFMEVQIKSMKQLLTGKLYLKEHDVEIELVTSTGYCLLQSKLDWAISRSNGNTRSLVWLLLQEFLNIEKLMELSTGAKVYEHDPLLAKAITGYVKRVANVDVIISEYTDIINKHLQALKPKKDGISKPGKRTLPKETIVECKKLATDSALSDFKEGSVLAPSPSVITDDKSTQRIESPVSIEANDEREEIIARGLDGVSNVRIQDLISPEDKNKLEVSRSRGSQESPAIFEHVHEESTANVTLSSQQQHQHGNYQQNPMLQTNLSHPVWPLFDMYGNEVSSMNAIPSTYTGILQYGHQTWHQQNTGASLIQHQSQAESLKNSEKYHPEYYQM